MFMNYRNMADFYSIMGDDDQAAVFRAKAFHMKEAINAVLWSAEDEIWYDYDIFNKVS